MPVVAPREQNEFRQKDRTQNNVIMVHVLSALSAELVVVEPDCGARGFSL
jgi:hypothetical protein